MMPVLGDLPVAENVLCEGFAIVWEVENVQHVVLLFLHHFPAEVYYRFQAKSFMIFLPSVTHKNRIRFR